MMEFMCCHCPTNYTQKDSKSNPRQEIWRLRLNWLFLIIIGSLYAISYTAISSSFHQFMTNPRIGSFNDTIFERIEPGLGQTEAFYSWVITLFNVGALIGGFGTGCLVKFIPYWYLILVSLVLHTVGYILYAISNEGWLIMTSKLLSGFFIGAELTLALSYFAESSIDYQAAMKELGKSVESSESVRNNLFALHNIGVNIGYFLGPGAAALFAQFQIDQFRSIAWYNVAFGVLFMALQIVLFRGESTCKTAKRCQICQSQLRNLNISAMENIYVLCFLILCRGVLSFRFGAYETIYNPVLSDYFGLSERDSSYFFFGLVIAQTSGTVLLLIFQYLRLNSRIIAIIGLVMTVLSCILMADWQSIPYDPCTELSPFHHPDIISHYRDIESPDTFTRTKPTKRDIKCEKPHQNRFGFTIYASIQVKLHQTPIINANGLACTEVDTCSRDHCNDAFDQCLHYTLDTNWCLQESKYVDYPTDYDTGQFLCKQPLYSLCITIYRVNEAINESLQTVHSQALQLLEVDLYAIAVNKCESANIHGHQCYWIPNSIVTKRHCSDCPPICRSRQHSLTFVQFCIGAALLMVSIPIAWVPVAALISDRIHKEAQGLVMGIIVALTAIGRSISPLWLDAAYEGLMKRTFVAMLVLLATHLPFLIGIIFMYRKLGSKPTESAFKDFEEESDDNESDMDSSNENKLD